VAGVNVGDRVGEDYLGLELSDQRGQVLGGHWLGEDVECCPEDGCSCLGLGYALGLVPGDGDGDAGVAGVQGEGAAGP